MSLDKLINLRRSVRSYSRELISKKELSQLIDAFQSSPSSCNLQLTKLILVNDKKLLKKLEKKVTGKINWTSQIFVLIINKKINYENNAHYLSAGMATQNLFLKAQELGIATCPIAGFKNKSYLKKILNIPDIYDIPLLIFFGYPELKDNFSKPYKTQDILSKNKYDFQYSFPESIKLENWRKKDILEYRKRISSVYYPRLKHGLWGNSLDFQFKPYLNNNRNKSKLIYFMWERNFLNLVSKSNQITLVDYDNEYLYYMKKNHGYSTSLIGKQSKKKYDSFFIANSLEFNPDLEEVIYDVSNKLNKGARGVIIIFNTKGVFSLFFNILYIFGILKNVYHNSPFYKIGPYRFVDKNFLISILDKYNLEIKNTTYLRSSLLKDKFKNPILRRFISFMNYLFPENIKLTIIKK